MSLPPKPPSTSLSIYFFHPLDPAGFAAGSPAVEPPIDCRPTGNHHFCNSNTGQGALNPVKWCMVCSNLVCDGGLRGGKVNK
ncbi:hypothetical protein PspLS_01067 [Pyricularia sp. CBS 133598]|nr:hypothetical protein PspLS_01067 [Pyricularia sp. CBS 133598]